MSKHAAPIRRLSGVSALALGLLVLSAGAAAADTTPPGDASYSQNGSSADAYSSTCTVDGDVTSCVEQQIYAFVGKMTDSVTGVSHASQLCVYLSTYSFSETTGEYIGTPLFEQGCRTDLPSGAIRIDSKLSTATLAPTIVSVEDILCEKFGCEPGSARDVLAVATWSGFGPLQASKYRSSYGDGTCRSHEAAKGSSRSADVVGSLDGHDLAGDAYGSLFSGRYSFRSSCTEV
jgi:hypothetical protein